MLQSELGTPHMPRTPKHMRTKVAAVLVAGGLLGSAACYPGAVTEPEDSDVVLTVFDTTADFSAVASYFMPDSVVRIGDDESTILDDTVREFDEAILAQVEAQFTALGYRRIQEPGQGTPDGVVLVSVNTTEQTEWVPGCWYCYWDWYPWGPDWEWSWGPGYEPDYPFGPDLGTRTLGTLLVTLLDPVTVGTELRVWWAGAATALLSEGSEADLARVQQAIGQMFVQSPYLAEGGEG